MPMALHLKVIRHFDEVALLFPHGHLLNAYDGGGDEIQISYVPCEQDYEFDPLQAFHSLIIHF